MPFRGDSCGMGASQAPAFGVLLLAMRDGDKVQPWTVRLASHTLCFRNLEEKNKDLDLGPIEELLPSTDTCGFTLVRKGIWP